MKLDKKDYKILWNMDYGARVPAGELAKKLKTSKQALNYRLKKLFENNIIQKAVSVIDIHRLGYLTYRSYVRLKNVDDKSENKFIKYFRNHSNVLWMASFSGAWDVEIVFVARNFIHFYNLWKEAKEEMGEYMLKYDLSMSVVNYHFPRDYLIDKKRKNFDMKYYGFEPKNENLDKLDQSILAQLSDNCRQSNLEIGEKVGTSYHTVRKRIERMESRGIIQSHRLELNLDKLGLQYYKLLLSLRNPKKEDEKRMWEFCSKYNFVAYIVEVLGEWQLEVELETKSEKQFYDFFRDFKNEFAELIEDYRILSNIKEEKLDYLPMKEI